MTRSATLKSQKSVIRNLLIYNTPLKDLLLSHLVTNSTYRVVHRSYLLTYVNLQCLLFKRALQGKASLTLLHQFPNYNKEKIRD